jgi:hypothetical protein
MQYISVRKYNRNVKNLTMFAHIVLKHHVLVRCLHCVKYDMNVDEYSIYVLRACLTVVVGVCSRAIDVIESFVNKCVGGKARPTFAHVTMSA